MENKLSDLDISDINYDICSMLYKGDFNKCIGYGDEKLTLAISIFVYRSLYTNPFMLPLIFIYCDAPFIDKNQIYILMRCKRKLWSIGQIIYIFMTSAMYFSLIAAMTIVLNIRNIEYMNDWGKVLGTLAFSNVPLVKGTAVTISTYILTYFTPTQAMFFTWLLSVLCGGILGLIIYGCNVISKSKVVGIVASGFLVILSAAVSGNEMAQWFSPVSWTTLNKLDVGKLTQYPTFTYVMVVYMTAIIILSVWIIKVIEKRMSE